MTTEEFIQKAKAVHGDKYDYSKVEYVNSKTKVCIICPEHGEFLQTPEKHLIGRGCPACSRVTLARRFSMGQDKFIQRANEVHHGKYDYSQVVYINSHTLINIICPLHGVFCQDPSSHLKGCGCPTCADIENGVRRRLWTYEACYEEAKNYTTKLEFRNQSRNAYGAALKYGWLDSFTWLYYVKQPNGYWTRERCEQESRKYHSKTEFEKGSPAAHHAAAVHNWLDEFEWLIDQRFDINEGKVDCVYVYIFEETKVAYVGRTLIRRQKKRDREHIFNQENDAVARYAKKHHVPIPHMTIIETDLTLKEGLDREDYWREWYKAQGYTMLNRSATGIGKGSLGSISNGKWTRKRCYEEALKYRSASEFGRANGSAYDAARRNGWLTDYTWFVKLWEAKWDRETCYTEAQKYKTRGEFYKESRGAYLRALREGWIDEYEWMPPRRQKPSGYWDNYDHCYEEAKKYKNKRRFQKGSPGAYTKAYQNGWLDDYTWFEANRMNYWNEQTCYEEAKKYDRLTAFARQSVRAYTLAKKNGWIDNYTWFKRLTGFWTYETCKAEAAKYDKRGQFKKGCIGAYTKSRVNGWLDEFFPN